MLIRNGIFSGSYLAFALVSGLLATGCGGEDAGAPSGGTPDSVTEPSVRSAAAKAARDVALARRAEAAIATDRVVVKLAKLPPALKGKPLTAPAWTGWLQDALGPDVQVSSARVLGPRRAALGPVDGSSLVVRVATTTTPKIRAAVSRAAGYSSVARAEVDPIWTPHAVPNDPRFAEQWHLPKIRAPQAWDTVTGSPNVVVAVLDSGLDFNHADIAGAVWSNPGEVADGVDNDGNGLIDDVRGWNFAGNNSNVADISGHGTHVAGLIGARGNNGVGVAGVAYGVQLMPLLVGAASIQASDVAEAIYYAVDEGADIVNMSFGGPETFAGARDAVDYAIAHGVLLFASAGNNSHDEYNYPAVYQDVVAVAATAETDARAGLSNYGRWVDISAPGANVVSTLPGNEYGPVSGTSQATPIVAGVAALVKSAHPTWTADQIRVQVLAAADNIGSLNPDFSGLLGAGRVDAQEAVGPAITAPRPYVAGLQVLEATGNGDQEVGAGESATITVPVHFTSATANARVRLVSNDAFVTVATGPVTLTTSADRTSVASFTVNVAGNVPSNRLAALTVQTESTTGTIFTQTPITVPVASAYRHLELPWAYERNLLPLPNGTHVLVADELREPPNFDRVYAAFRNGNGSFTPPVVFSDPTRNARRPQAVVASNGDIHVVYSQFVATLDFAGFPAYTRYTAATGQWSTPVLFSSGAQLTRFGERNTSIALDSSGAVHVAFASGDAVLTQRLVSGSWTPQVAHPVGNGSQDTREVQLVSTSAGLRLFVRPVANPLLGTPTFDRPMSMLSFSSGAWSAPVQLTGVGPNELAHLPFAFSGTARRFYQPAGGTQARLAQLGGNAWSGATVVQNLDGTGFLRGYFGLMWGASSFSSYLARPFAATQGSEREVIQSGVTTPLRGDRKLRATSPTFTRTSTGTLHVFNQEQELFRVPGTGNFLELPSFTSYYTTASLVSSALPTVPVVVDAGATTEDDRVLSASWSSSHGSGVASYRVAVGSAPGGDDLLPWQETTATSLVFDLGDQRLLPGQTAYFSVKARSGALLSSDIGVSNGITFVGGNRCFAPAWIQTVVYHDPGILVTYQGATYENLYWQSHQTPGASPAWKLVSECTGTPIVPPCTAPAWSASQRYVAGDRVAHSGFEFVNLWPSSTPPDGSSGNPWKWVVTCQP